MTHHLRFLETGHTAKNGKLYILRKRRGESGKIHFIRVLSFRLHKNLVPFLIRKAHHLIFNRRTIAGTGSFDTSVVHRRTGDIFPNQLMPLLRRISQIAVFLHDLYRFRVCRERKGHYRHISLLYFHL